MFAGMITKKLNDWFRDEVFTTVSNGGTITIDETEEGGQLEFQYSVSKDAICIHHADRYVPIYLSKGPNSHGATKCADAFVFLNEDDDENNNGDVLIVELKKTVNSSSYAKAKIQLTMGIYNARAIAAFLGIKIHRIRLSCVYKDNTLISPIQLRIMNSTHSNELSEWQNGCLCLTIDERQQSFEFIPQQLP